MPTALLPQHRQRGSNDPKHPKIVRLEQSANDQGITGIVENDVEPAEVPVSSRNPLTHLFRVRDVKRKRQNVLPELFGKIGHIG